MTIKRASYLTALQLSILGIVKPGHTNFYLSPCQFIHCPSKLLIRRKTMKKSFSFIIVMFFAFMALAVLNVTATPAFSAEIKLCWCCINGEVQQMTPGECQEKHGRCYATKEEALKRCQPQDNCRMKYPNPRIRYDHKDAAGRIYIPVVNWSSYSNEMFRPAPDLPPCGLNTSSSRTWVDIYDADTNKRIYGFCALGSSDGLQKIWFMPKTKKGRVYIVLKDRACKKHYKSNTIAWPGRGATELGPQPEPPDIK